MAPFAEGAKPLHVILHSHGSLLSSYMCRLPESQGDHWCCQPSVRRCPLWSRHRLPAPPHSPPLASRPRADSSTLHTIPVLPLLLTSRSAPNTLHHPPLDRTATLPAMPCPYTHTGKQFFSVRKGVNSHITYFLIQWHFMEWFLNSKYLYDSSYLWF